MALYPFMLGFWGKTLLKEKRLFFYFYALMNLHKRLYTTDKWDGKSYWLKAKITANPQDVIKSIDSLVVNSKDAFKI